MLSAAVLAAGVAMADGVESSDIVGYNTKTVTTAGYQEMVGASFNSVGAEALDIQDITLVGDNATGTSWIKWWDPATKTYSPKAVYVDTLCDPSDPTGDTDLDYGGWGDNDWFPVVKTFAPGEGFWFSPAKNGVGITTAGSVEKTANQYVGRTVAVAGQQIMVLNAFPTALDIQSIVLEGDSAAGTTWIKWWNSASKTYSPKAVYVDTLCDPSDPTGDTDLDYGGWGDNDWFPVDKEFAVGDGFWFSPAKNNVTICFPNPFYVAP